MARVLAALHLHNILQLRHPPNKEFNPPLISPDLYHPPLPVGCETFAAFYDSLPDCHSACGHLNLPSNPRLLGQKHTGCLRQPSDIFHIQCWDQCVHRCVDSDLATSCHLEIEDVS